MDKWWKAPDGDVHTSVSETLATLSQYQSFRRAENLKHARLYGNLDILGLNVYAYNLASPKSIDHKITLNIIQSCIDTAAAKISKNRPKASFLTEDGDWSLKKKAKYLTKYVAGAFYQNKTYEETDRCFVDGGVFGTGAYKVFSEDGRIRGERANVDELTIDDAEAVYGRPRTLYQTKAVSRDVLKALYPKFRGQIDDTQPIGVSESPLASGMDHDMIAVRESWRLASGRKTKDGRHAITIQGATLEVDDWDKDYFPFAFFRWNPKQFGFFGQGIAEQLIGKQIEINKLLKLIQRAHHLGAAPTGFIEKGSKVIKSHLSNEVLNLVEYEGVMPVIQVFQTIHPEIYQHLQWLIQSSFEEIGISQLSAAAKKPDGLDSGKALREFNDIESERFMKVGQRWETFHLDIGDLMILEAKDLYEKDKSFKVKLKGKRSIQEIKWADVDMEEDQYVMQAFPISGLSGNPSDRLSEVQEMMQAGLIDAQTGMELLDFPDLDAEKSVKFAPRDIIRDIIERIVEEGEYISPEPYFDLKYGVYYGSHIYARAKLDGLDEERLELIRRFVDACDQMNPENQPQPAVPQLQAPMDPSIAANAGMGAPPPLPQAPLMQAQ